MPKLEPAPRRALRLQLGVLLRRYREASGRDPRDVRAELDWHLSKLSKLEAGGVTVSAAELNLLIELYRVADDDAEQLRELGKQARRRGPVRQEVYEYARTYLDLEQVADEVKLHWTELMPGMLQIEAYARALLRTGPSHFTDAQIDEYAAARAARFQRFVGSGPGASLWLVLGEAALLRPVGGRDVHRQQLAHLRKAAELPRVTLQIMPFEAGEYSALGNDFTILEIQEPALTMVYVEAISDALYHDEEPHLERYRVLFNKAQVAAASERDSARMVEARLRDLA